MDVTAAHHPASRGHTLSFVTRLRLDAALHQPRNAQRARGERVNLGGWFPLSYGQQSLRKLSCGLFAEPQSDGNAGALSAIAGSLSVQAGAERSSRTSAARRAGSIEILADDVTLDGKGSSRFTGIFVTRVGNGGTVSLTGQSLRIVDGADISSSTISPGDAGDVFVRAGRAEITGARLFQLAPGAPPSLFEGIAASAEGGATSGRDSSVHAQFGSLLMSYDGLITARPCNWGRGDSGHVLSDDIALSGGACISVDTRSTGNSGNVVVTTWDKISIPGPGSRISSETGASPRPRKRRRWLGLDCFRGLQVTDGGRFSAATAGDGSVGDVTVTASQGRVLGPSTIDEDTRGAGVSGQIHMGIALCSCKTAAGVRRPPLPRANVAIFFCRPAFSMFPGSKAASLRKAAPLLAPPPNGKSISREKKSSCVTEKASPPAPPAEAMPAPSRSNVASLRLDRGHSSKALPRAPVSLAASR